MFTFRLLCFTSFFKMNPLGAMPVFMTMTMELDEKERRKVARRASLVSFLIMMFFAISGDLLFRFFGISIDSLRIVGGIIFLIMGMDMLQARLVKTKVKESEVKSYVNDISITPLSIPMLCGPGAITNAIVMWNKATDWETKMIMVIAVAVVITLVYLILRSSSRIIKILGETGNNVMMRLMGLIVMVIAVEFFFERAKTDRDRYFAFGRLIFYSKNRKITKVYKFFKRLRRYCFARWRCVFTVDSAICNFSVISRMSMCSR